MLNENIRHFRKVKGMSQEEMAVKLHVVRQTVSKWEQGLSVPDADLLIRMAELLGVTVSQLLGIPEAEPSAADMAEELARVNEQLAQKQHRENRLALASRKRGMILFLSFLAMLMALIVKNEIVSVVLVGVCMAAAVVILYRNLALLTSVTTEDLRIGVLRAATVFNGVVFVVGIAAAILIGLDMISLPENGEKVFAMSIVSCVILFAGLVSPRLPFTRHTGLRLPWTVQDEETWNLAHRIIGYISLPIVLLYTACTWTVPHFEAVTLGAMLAWVGIPGVISYIFFHKKMYGKL